MPDSSRGYKVAVCGASGAVGREMVRTLEERRFPVSELTLLASERSAGETVSFGDDDVRVQLLDSTSFNGIEIALFSAGGQVSKTFAPLAADAGCVVIDNTSAFRMDPEVPLVVPEVNPEDIAEYHKRGIIANPNCSTIQMVVVLKPLEDAVPIKRVVVSTYQSVSGAGRAGIKELEGQCLSVFNLKKIHCETFPRQIAFNCLPHIGAFLPNGFTQEEQKMIDETRKIMHRPDIKVTATTVRVPVFYGHSEAVNIEFEKKLTAERARDLLAQAPGIRLIDSQNGYPTVLDAIGQDETMVGRIREDPSLDFGLDLWIVADNVRKGAALNAIQIAERLVKEYF